MNELFINAVRFLSVEAVQKAKSGHPGIAMGAAPAVSALWGNVMKHNPKNPKWKDRDRFVLSAGHGSSMLYSLLHLFGYGLTVEDLKNFRQFGGPTPGHPEYAKVPGVEVTTGPLGQGIANAVGFAMAESHLAALFNKPDIKLVDHYTYALCGDGCMMEGISSEAASLAGTLGLGKLTLLYDSNGITIEGSTDIAFRENVRARFEAYGWHTQLVADGNDTGAVLKAIETAKSVTGKPSLIEIKTIIGFGAPNKQGTASAHGAPFGDDEIALAKKNLNWPCPEPFEVPDEVYSYAEEWRKAAHENEDEWNVAEAKYAVKYPEDYAKWMAYHSGYSLTGFENEKELWEYEGSVASRISSETVLNRIWKYAPNLFGGAADLSPSTNSIMKGRGDYSQETPEGSNLHFGVREHAMTGIANGIAAHGGLRPYVAGFFVFSDYMKPSMRLSAMMELPVIYIMTHDSIGVGEDGPTHEPVEQLAMLRSIPGFTVFRPCDTNETAAGWALALARENSPTALILSRQNLTLLPESGKGAFKGAYVLRDSANPTTDLPDILLMASGSEVELIYKAFDVLKDGHGVFPRVISFPSFEIFEEQSAGYKESVLPNILRARVAVEAASGFGWHKYIGLDGEILSVDTFGASGPYSTLFKEYGFTVERIVERALAVIENN